MSEYREFTGKTVEEALREAREAFGAELNDLDFEILTPGSRGVLGMGAEPARIVAAPRSALGGAAPKREAAAATPLPAPTHEDRATKATRTVARAATTGPGVAIVTAARAATTGPVARAATTAPGVAIVTVARAATTAPRARMEAAEP